MPPKSPSPPPNSALDSAFDEEIADEPPKNASTSTAASLSYNNKAFVNAETKGNASEMFGKVTRGCHAKSLY
jgi:activator of HSP90 ATPase